METIPWPGPYLQADPARRQIWRARLAELLPRGYRRVGVVWAGRPTHNNDSNRSTELSALRCLGSLPGTVLVSLQKGAAATQAADWFGRAPLVAIGPEIGNYADTMAILEELDILVTVDTSVGHLAGRHGAACLGDAAIRTGTGAGCSIGKTPHGTPPSGCSGRPAPGIGTAPSKRVYEQLQATAGA